MNKVSLFTGLLLCLITSCAPKITTNIAKNYPPLSPDEPIEVYTDEKNVPADAELLGSVRVRDSGVSTKCDSATVIELIKTEVRKAGGNGILITEHKRPSIWGSSCHQMTGDALKITDFSATMPEDSIVKHLSTNNLPIRPKMTLPKIKFAANFGYGWRTAKLHESITGDMRTAFKKVLSGPVWDASFNYYFNDNWGIGLNYAGYYSSHDERVQNTETLAIGQFEIDNSITYIGPACLMRASSNTKWFFNANIGLGYIGYSSKLNVIDTRTKTTGGSVGFLTEVGAEYKFSENWGLGANLSAISGSLGKVSMDVNGKKESVKFNSKEHENLHTIRLSFGLRYYIN